MPIYEYQCTNCHHQLDLMQKIGEPPATKCPNCSKDKLIKLVSAAGFQLKGTGWYATDFKDKKTGTSSSPETKEKTNVSTDTGSKESQ